MEEETVSFRRAPLIVGLSVAAGAAPPAPAAPSVVINEFVARPAAGEGEWLELRNTGTAPVNLAGWAVADGTDRARELGDPPVLAPGALLLVAARPESLRVHYALADSVLVVRPATWPVLNDRDGEGGDPADRLRLLDPAGAAADSVVYFEAWLPPQDGRSLERVAVEARGDDPGAWAWSEDVRGATPGRPNSLHAAENPDAVLSGPERVTPGTGAAVFSYRVPGPGSLELRLVDREGGDVALLREPGPAAATGTWVWGASAPRPPRAGLYLLCLLWRGATAGLLRRCVCVWVEP
jgi:hypothetical protein